MNDLAIIVSDICQFYQRRIPGDTTLELWGRKLEGMNLRAARRRILEIVTNGDSFPRNLPAAVRAGYSAWLRDQPKDTLCRGCSQCLDGLLHALGPDGNMYAFRCGHCQTSLAAYPVETRYSLTEKGYKLHWPHDFKQTGKPEPGAVDALIRQAVDRFAPDQEEIPF